ncbi:HAD family hydrolase [Swingsia samuiensis]|uniref:HAD family phosphatase n=1 Tax=Swingsia samuiensis TaxID=1293412 RepID=A0A4Y6UJ91_9PROT|nr:HAD family phosphatase [Swingsia samuiensis]QDH16890.1 HAD family phosphatase [Swingsia samuiensis]
MTTALDANGKLKLVIFDCDGVLVDSERPSNHATAEFARSQGLNISDEEAFRRFAGKAIPQVIKELEDDLGRSLPENSALNLRKKIVQVMEKMAVPIDGSPEMLADIVSLRMPFRVGSNSSLKEMEVKFKISGISQFFEENRIHSANDMGAPKPSPEVYLYASQAEGVMPENCVVIEDSDTGAEAARRAGMSCILLRSKEEALPPFWPVKGFVQINHLSELAPLLGKVLEEQQSQ